LNHEIIRVTTPADLRRVRQLDLAVFGAEAYNEQQWNSEFGAASVAIWVALAAEKAVGFCSAAIVGDDFEIRKIGVLPEHRRFGVAKRMLHSASDHASTLLKRNALCLIDVAANNTGALAFYARVGFKEIARRKRYYANGDDAILMQKV